MAEQIVNEGWVVYAHLSTRKLNAEVKFFATDTAADAWIRANINLYARFDLSFVTKRYEVTTTTSVRVSVATPPEPDPPLREVLDGPSR